MFQLYIRKLSFDLPMEERNDLWLFSATRRNADTQKENTWKLGRCPHPPTHLHFWLFCASVEMLLQNVFKERVCGILQRFF